MRTKMGARLERRLAFGGPVDEALVVHSIGTTIAANPTPSVNGLDAC